jgi:hypothetical protein
MARCTMRSIYAGPKGTIQPGRVFVGSRAEVDAMIAGGYATALADESPGEAESAAVEAPEDATAQRGARRRGRLSSEE